jgi:PhnB protein
MGTEVQTKPVTAGVIPVQVMFWGDRFGAFRDPFGVQWAMNAPVDKA